MNSRRFMFLIAITSTVLALTLELAAQHTRYRLIDTGTLGGPASYGSVNAPGYKILNNSGTLSTWADTPNIAPPELCENPGCFVSHATRWQKGVLTDLGALSGVDNSSA